MDCDASLFFTSTSCEFAQMTTALRMTVSGRMHEPMNRADDRQDGVLSVAHSIADGFEILAASPAAQFDLRVRALSSGPDGENLHKIRVALRRLRSLWWAYQPYLNKKEARAHRREFKTLADAAGQTRDWDILREVVAYDESTKYSFKTLLEDVDSRRRDVFIRSRESLERADATQLLRKRIDSTLGQPRAQRFEELLPAFARRRIDDAGKSLDRKVQRAAAHQTPEYSELHELRIAGKKLRYLLEFFLPVLDDCDPANIKVLSSLQDELGMVNDLVASEALLLKHEAQFRDPRQARSAICYVGEQKVHRMQNAYQLLHAVDRMLAFKRA